MDVDDDDVPSTSNAKYFVKKLSFSIHKWSSYSGNFHPRNILNDQPFDQTSRWTSESNSPPQYLILKLPTPAILKAITFGKFEKTHVCNLKKFKVLGGLTEDANIELLNEGLKNDCRKEMFELRHELYGKDFPCQYVKIVPLMAWGPSFSFSIWHICLHGVDDPVYVRPRLKWFNNFKEQEVIRLCLKYFREKSYTDVFEALQKKSKIALEHHDLTDLHNAIVVNGDFSKAEEIIEKAASSGHFNEYLNKENYKPKWTRITPLTPDGLESAIRPGMRGGHQMIIDSQYQLIFLLGGWDGTRDLSDFWLYNIKNENWQCISQDTKADGGPSARSCHKICFDWKRRHLYILGRYLESDDRHQLELKSDFYRYELDSASWQCLSDDTAADGGPSLIFDHQMVYDSITEKIFVFGGRILLSNQDERTVDPCFSGLFSYHVENGTWEKLRDDYPRSGEEYLRARSGHSMLLDEEKRLLYIFAGQRGKDKYLSDFLSYHIDTGKIEYVISKNKKEIPSAGFTQRSTMDVNLQEIYVLSGLSRDKEKKDDSNALWVLNLNSNYWVCIYKNENTTAHYWNRMDFVEPRPRFAHQLVYDSVQKVHYLFGGNPGPSGSSKIRLDDFWKLELSKTSLSDLVRQCKYKIRKLRYEELVKTNPVDALSYLQENIFELVDSSINKEREEFESLTTSLFATASPASSSDDDNKHKTAHVNPTVKVDKNYKARTEVYNQLCVLFPESMVQPLDNLTDLITF